MSFSLDKYIEGLCWKAYLVKRLDRSLEFEDVLQEARLALAKAEKEFDPTRGKWPTFAVGCVRNSLLNLLKSRKDADRLDDQHELSVERCESYIENARHFLNHADLSDEARYVLRAVFRSRLLSPYLCRAALRKSIGMSSRDFGRAVAELRKKYRRQVSHDCIT
jgi:RNA polymerase sigma factor (sigma-70 family)